MKPNFEHDCDKCVFLGRMEESLTVHPDFMPSDEEWERAFEANNKRDIDLYFCEQGGRPTVIARFSSMGPDYTSGMYMADHEPHLKVAKNLAIAKGLLG